MKLTLFILITSVALVAGCASAPKSSTGCVLLKFQGEPSAALCEQLAATQPNTTPQEVRDWFAKGERGFVLASSHTNEIAWAVALGATATTIHQISPAMMPTAWGHR